MLSKLFVLSYPILAFILPIYLAPIVDTYFNFPKLVSEPYNLLGALIFAIGALVVVYVTFIFFKIGKGTPAPTNPPKKLVVKGVFTYTRNPMYIGYFLILLGIVTFIQSVSLLIFVPFFALFVNFVILPWEEKQLEKRFGRDYLQYKKKVTRWLW